MISYIFPDKWEKAIMHAARSLTPAECNYSQIEKEALALIFALKKFHKMIFGHHFTLLTDHKPLLSIFGSKKGIPVYSASRLQCWASTLLEYDFEKKYHQTTEFGQAVALSCLIRSHSAPDDDTVIVAISIDDDLQWTLTDCVRGIPVTRVEIKQKRCSMTKCFKKLSSFSDANGNPISLESCNNFSCEGILWPSSMSVLCLQTEFWSLQNSEELFSNNYTQDILASIGWTP